MDKNEEPKLFDERAFDDGPPDDELYNRIALPRITEIVHWFRKGWTERSVCAELEICPNTWRKWKKKHADFLELIQAARKQLTVNVENALYKRAVGYDYEEVRVEKMKDQIKTVKTKKHMPADPSSMFFWLNNRTPENWSDRKQIEIAAENAGAKTVADLVCQQPAVANERNMN